MNRLNKLALNILVVLGLTVVLAASYGPVVSAARYDTPTIDSKLRMGVQSAIEWDSCRGSLDRSNPNTRRAINDSCAYADETWLSGRGTPKAVLPVDVPAGATSIGLQINSVKFLAGPVVEVDGNYNVSQIVDDGSRWVTNPGDANDRNPNARGASGQKPALVASQTRITGLRVVSGGGSISTDQIGSTFTISRDDISRYWFDNPKDITYTNPAGIKDGDIVTLELLYRRGDAYWKSGNRVETICVMPNDALYGSMGGGPNFGIQNNLYNCKEFASHLSIQFRVPFNYTLEPSIENIADNTVVSQDSSTPVTGMITNPGPTVTHDTIQYQISRTVFAPNVVPNKSGGYTDQSTPFCSWSQIANRQSCDSIGAATSQTYGVGTTRVPDVNGDVGALEIGTQICYTMSVQRYSSNETTGLNWRHSDMKCTIVGKYPAVHVVGGDLRVGRPMVGGVLGAGLVTTANTSRTTGIYGSWSEYAIVPRGEVKNMGSGSGYVGGVTPTGPSTLNRCSVSLLSFNNAAASTCTSTTTIGNYSSNAFIPDIGRRFSTVTSSILPSSSVNIAGQNLRGVYTTTNAALTIQGSAIANGRWVVIYAPGATVTIAGDINYDTAPITSAGQIPQLLIIARNILIQNNVTKIDAWLIANGTGVDGRINTCGAGGTVTETSALNTDVCDLKLTVNGPVAANHLYLRRTAGSDSRRGSAEDPAEVFNFRPDAYLWATEYSAKSGRLPTVTSKELPPRF